MKTWIALTIGIVAIALIALFSFYLINPNFESPLITLNALNNFGDNFFDKPSPSNWIREDQITVYPDRIVIMIPNATLSRYAATKSMDPVFDVYANGIEIKPTSQEQIHVGDIIAFQPNINSIELVVHRVINIGTDEQGWYCITKGDNSAQTDGKIRFGQIHYITIMIIY